MKTIQDYINRYNTVARNLGYSGESINILIQLLAQASYIEEMENATYMREASLEKSSLINSKIQHCVNNMYSVFRGSCPRIIMKIRPTKYLNLNPYDKIIESQNFDVYYLGYYKVTDTEGNIIIGGDSEGSVVQGGSLVSAEEAMKSSSSKVIDVSCNSTFKNTDTPIETINPSDNLTIDELLAYSDYTGSWEYSASSFYPAEEDNPSGVQIIIGFIAPKRIGEVLTIDKTINANNTYYVDCPLDNLSDDLYIEINGQRVDRTRIFSEHVLNYKIFDLTLPSFGSRLYVANYFKDTVERDSSSVVGIEKNTKVFAKYFGFSKLSDYNENELKRLRFKGANLVPFDTVQDKEGNIYANPFLVAVGCEELNGNPGVCLIEATDRDDINTIHYKANRDRYVNSIMRSNSDIGTVLEETYPNIIKSGGTSHLFSVSSSEKKNSSIDIYYIPKESEILLSESEIEKFKKEKRAYYIITTNISINPGTRYVATFNIDLDLYKHNSENDYDKKIGKEILQDNYEKKFNVVFNDQCLREIESLITKNSEVKKINSLSVSYTDESGRNVYIDPDLAGQYYFDIKYSITTSVTTTYSAS